MVDIIQDADTNVDWISVLTNSVETADNDNDGHSSDGVFIDEEIDEEILYDEIIDEGIPYDEIIDEINKDFSETCELLV